MDAGVDIELVYVTIVLLAGSSSYIYLYTKLSRGSDRRRRWVLRRRRFDAIATESAASDPSALARQRAVESIERSFTVTRRLLGPLVLVLTLTAASLPFLERVPGVFVSLVATAVTVLAGVASRPIIENVISGLTLGFSKTMSIGDTVEVEGHYGTIEDIQLVHTVVKVWDSRRLVVPNTKMLQCTVVNYSLIDRSIWCHVEFWVAPETDLRTVEAVAMSVPACSPHHTAKEAPKFGSWSSPRRASAAGSWRGRTRRLTRGFSATTCGPSS